MVKRFQHLLHTSQVRNNLGGMSFADVDITDTLACKRMIDLFVNKVILCDDYFDIVFTASEDNTQNIKLENIEDFTNLENTLNNKKEQF